MSYNESFEVLYTNPTNISINISSWIFTQTAGNYLLFTVILHERDNPYGTVMGFLWSQVSHIPRAKSKNGQVMLSLRQICLTSIARNIVYLGGHFFLYCGMDLPMEMCHFMGVIRNACYVSHMLAFCQWLTFAYLYIFVSGIANSSMLKIFSILLQYRSGKTLELLKKILHNMPYPF